MRLSRTAVLLTAALVQGCVSISSTPASSPTAPLTNPASQPAATPSQPPASVPPTATAAPAATVPSAPLPTSPTTPSAATPTTQPTTTPSGRPVFSSVDEANAQTVDWHVCTIREVAGECATIYVPKSYEQPSLGTTAIAVARFHTAADPIGHLFINPGGPGGAGIGFAAQLTGLAPDLAANFAFVGFDPRGTGQSDPLTCLDNAQLDALNAFDPTPESADERQQGIELVDEQGKACEENSGLLADHVTTIETARDIDVIRAVLGDDKLDYFGFSYGTLLGTTYAALFPDKVGRFVLDGALAPGLSGMEASEIQTQGLQTAITAYIKDCISQPDCPLGTTVADGQANLRKLLVDVDATPLSTNDSARPLTQALAFYGIIDTMYSPSSWPVLTSALGAALSGDGSQLLRLSDEYFQRQNGGYVNNELQANQAINCLDEQVAGGPTQIPESTFTRDSPIFGDIMFGLGDRGCGDWVPRTSLTSPDYSAPGSPPILVVGTTRDPATPLVWARNLADTLSQGLLLTRDGDGHTAYLSGNPCIATNVEAFLIDGTVPADNTRC